MQLGRQRCQSAFVRRPDELGTRMVDRYFSVATVLNPAPAAPLDDDIFALCDYVTPNETETEELTGIPVKTVDDARKAADALLAKGAANAIITLGEQSQCFTMPACLSTCRRSTQGQWWRPPVQVTRSTAALPWAWRRTSIRCLRSDSAAPLQAYR